MHVVEVDPFRAQFGKDHVADLIAPDTRGKICLPAKPSHCDGRIGRTTAADDRDIAGPVFFAAGREFVEVVDEVQRRDAAYENMGHGQASLSGRRIITLRSAGGRPPPFDPDRRDDR